MKKKSFIFLLLAAFTILFIFSNSFQPGESSSETSSIFVEMLKSLFYKIHIYNIDSITYIIRKSAHIFEFCMLSVWISLFFITGKYCYKNHITDILLICLFTACVDEYIQLFSQGRSSLVQDIFIDFTGGLIGVAVCAVGLIIYRKKRPS